MYFSDSFNHLKWSLDNKELGDGINGDDVSVLKLSYDEKILVCGDKKGNVFVYNAADFILINEIQAHEEEITAIDIIDYNGEYVMATGSSDNAVHIYMGKLNEVLDEKDIFVITECSHDEPISSIVLIKCNGIKLITGGYDNTLLFYSITERKCEFLNSYKDGVKIFDMCFNIRREKVFTAHEGKIMIWNINTALDEKTLEVKKGDSLIDNFIIAVDEAGWVIATSCSDHCVRIRNSYDGQLISRIPLAETVSCLFFAIANKYLIAASSHSLTSRRLLLFFQSGRSNRGRSDALRGNGRTGQKERNTV